MLAIRLRRTGSKKRPSFRIVVTDSRKAREGRFVETLGHYNARTSPEVVRYDPERMQYWLSQGAAPSDTIKSLLKKHPASEMVATQAVPATAPSSDAGSEQSTS